MKTPLNLKQERNELEQSMKLAHIVTNATQYNIVLVLFNAMKGRKTYMSHREIYEQIIKQRYQITYANVQKNINILSNSQNKIIKSVKDASSPGQKVKNSLNIEIYSLIAKHNALALKILKKVLFNKKRQSR